MLYTYTLIFFNSIFLNGRKRVLPYNCGWKTFTSTGLEFLFGEFIFSPPDQVSNQQNPGYLLYIGDYTTQLYMGMIINQYKDSY